MSRPVTWIDRLRIERAVWMLDQRLYNLPRRSRIARRREVRANLLTAAPDIGTTEALRHLGDPRRLAAEYVAAELGEKPRPSWIGAAAVGGTVPYLFTWILSVGTGAFGDGIVGADPQATGTFTWSGIRYLQESVTYTFVDGRGSSVGGAWTPLLWAVWIVLTVVAGRLWRLLPTWPRRRSPDAAEVLGTP
jgi:hypothetical protein